MTNQTPAVLDVEALRCRLAAIEHQRWADWQRWMHEQCDEVNGHLVIPPDLVQRWERQIATPFEELSEGEQRADLEQVDRYWPLIGPALTELVGLRAEVARLLVVHEAGPVEVWEGGPVEEEPARLGRREPECAYADDYPAITAAVRAAREAEEVERG